MKWLNRRRERRALPSDRYMAMLDECQAAGEPVPFRTITGGRVPPASYFEVQAKVRGILAEQKVAYWVPQPGHDPETRPMHYSRSTGSVLAAMPDSALLEQVIGETDPFMTHAVASDALGELRKRLIRRDRWQTEAWDAYQAALDDRPPEGPR